MLGIKQFDKSISFGIFKVTVNTDDNNSTGFNLLRRIQSDSFFAGSSKNIDFPLHTQFAGVEVTKGNTNGDVTDFIINADQEKESYLIGLFKKFGVSYEIITKYFRDDLKEALKLLGLQSAIWNTMDTPIDQRVLTTKQVQKMCKLPPDKLGLEQAGENTWRLGSKFENLYRESKE